jgi:hypothetical protein
LPANLTRRYRRDPVKPAYCMRLRGM